MQAAGRALWRAVRGPLAVLLVVLVLRALDSTVDKPSGVIKLSWFTGRPASHGYDACSHDYEGSWKVGLAAGSSPISLNVSAAPAISCDLGMRKGGGEYPAPLGNALAVSVPSVSFVADPYLHIPTEEEGAPPGRWYAFYEMKELSRYIGEIGVSVSDDQGDTWTFAGTALAEPFHLSYPWVTYDREAGQYVMIPETGKSGDGTVHIYTCSAATFPLGWRLAKRQALLTPPMREALLAVYGGGLLGALHLKAGPPRFVDTSPVWDEAAGRWLLFATLLNPRYKGRMPRYSLYAYASAGPSLLAGEWTPLGVRVRADQGGGDGLPASAGMTEFEAYWAASAAAGVGHLLSTDQRYARSGGRAFWWDGALHRWAQDCAGAYGAALSLLRVTLNATAPAPGEDGYGDYDDGQGEEGGQQAEEGQRQGQQQAGWPRYSEAVVATYRPNTARASSWYAKRIHHMDVRPLPASSLPALEAGAGGGKALAAVLQASAAAAAAAGAAGPQAQAGEAGTVWVGLTDGDRFIDGKHHYLQREAWFVHFKALLWRAAAAAAALWVAVAGILSLVDGGPCCRPAAWRAYFAASGGGSDPRQGNGSGHGSPAWQQRVLRAGVAQALRLRRLAGRAWRAARPSLVLGGVTAAMLLTTLVASGLLLGAAPWAFPCVRSLVRVRPLVEHYRPAQPFVDPAAPYPITNLTIVAACSESFFGRLRNLVGSAGVWAPGVSLLVYDLGFTSQQLAELRCWAGVTVVRFPFERYEAAGASHVRELATYAVKPLSCLHALEGVRHGDAVLCLDCGMELRSPLKQVLHTLSQQGHVGAEQNGVINEKPFTDKYMRPFFNVSDDEWERIGKQPYCAGGVQGFVRGSAAERLVLRPAAACAMDGAACIAPEGHVHGASHYDQAALSILLRTNNFSSCLPMEVGAMSSVKKLSLDPRQPSSPVELVARRHRLPHPYLSYVQRRRSCEAAPETNPWRSFGSGGTAESVVKLQLGKRVQARAQEVVSLVVQACCCAGFHLLLQATWLLQAAALGAARWPRLAALRGLLAGAMLAACGCCCSSGGAPGGAAPDGSVRGSDCEEDDDECLEVELGLLPPPPRSAAHHRDRSSSALLAVACAEAEAAEELGQAAPACKPLLGDAAPRHKHSWGGTCKLGGGARSRSPPPPPPPPSARQQVLCTGALAAAGSLVLAVFSFASMRLTCAVV